MTFTCLRAKFETKSNTKRVIFIYGLTPCDQRTGEGLALGTLFLLFSLKQGRFNFFFLFAVANRRTLADLRNIEGHGPDGMTIDTNGNLWVAVFQSAAIYNVDGKNGKILRKIDIPALQVTSIAFGGRDLDEMYVTSGKYNVPEGRKFQEEGCTFKVTGLGVKGFPGIPFDFFKINQF